MKVLAGIAALVACCTCSGRTLPADDASLLEAGIDGWRADEGHCTGARNVVLINDGAVPTKAKVAVSGSFNNMSSTGFMTYKLEKVSGGEIVFITAMLATASLQNRPDGSSFFDLSDASMIPQIMDLPCALADKGCQSVAKLARRDGDVLGGWIAFRTRHDDQGSRTEHSFCVYAKAGSGRGQGSMTSARLYAPFFAQ